MTTDASLPLYDFRWWLSCKGWGNVIASASEEDEAIPALQTGDCFGLRPSQ